MESALTLSLNANSGGLSGEKAAACEDDAGLLERCRAGDGAAFNHLLHLHRDKILNLAFQMLRDRDAAEDVAQDTFVRALSTAAGFRGDSRLATWLYRIAVNLCLQRLRRERRKPSEEIDEDLAHDGDAESLALGKIALEHSLGALSPPLRAALILREMHGLEYEEIAVVLHLPVGTVRSRLHEARRRFRIAWEQHS